MNMFNNKDRRSFEGVNAGSMADIAFLLLIFFLIATTIDVDKGITVKLPPYDPDPISTPLPQSRVITVKVNASNQLLVENEFLEIRDFKKKVKNIILNPLSRPDYPSKPSLSIISLQNDKGTAYDKYIEVYNELKSTYRELWEKESDRKFGKTYAQLNKPEKKAVHKEFPFVVSEAEPTNYAQ